MKVLDLFCGAGGASTGLRSIGLDPIGFDAWPTACESHHANGHRTVCTDLDGYGWRGSCDLLWASPPCQPFSAAGDHGGADDDRDGMPAFLHAVRSMMPPIVVMENVKGLTFTKHRRYLAECTTELIRLGYDVGWRVLTCADYGVPQTRERLVVIARIDGLPVVWPRRTHSEDGAGLPRWVSMAEALGWGMTTRPYPTIASARKTGGPDKEAVGGSGARRGLYAEQASGRWVFDRPAMTIAGDPRVWPPGHKVNADDIAHGRTGHDRAGTDAIRVTVAEAATLQAFPPGYVFCGSRSAQFQQVGNAVPPTLAAVVVSAVLAAEHRAPTRTTVAHTTATDQPSLWGTT